MNVIFGTSGHAKEIYQLAKSNGIGIDFFIGLDRVNEYLNHIKIISEDDFFRIDPNQVDNIFLGIGNPSVRSKVHKSLRNNGYGDSKFPSLIHPDVIIDKITDKIAIGMGCVITRGCILTTEIVLGDFVHLNINSTVSHESEIGNFTTVSPCCCICGNVRIGECVFLGAHSTIIDRISVCNNVVIGAGAVIIRNISEIGTYCGVPAKKIK
jgi:sugar O-acyltransferase (sialic acid O-acetyltransferase NeuD family)